MPTVRLSEKTYKMLIRRQAEQMKKTGRRVTIDEVIRECLKSISPGTRKPIAERREVGE
jgi:hypothetical protein